MAASALELARQLRLPGLPDLDAWRWPIVHLAFAGGVTQLIIGAMTFFAIPLLMTTAPPRWLLRSQWLTVNAGALALAGGVWYGSAPVSALGGAGVLAAVSLEVVVLRLLRRRSLAPGDLTLRYFFTAVGFLLAGGTLGILMLLGLSDAVLPRGQVRLAHLHLNLMGWVTLTILGTLRLFFGSTLGVKASRLSPAWAEYWPLTVGTAIATIGWLAGQPIAVAVGSSVQALGIVAASVAVFRQWRAWTGVPSLAAGHLLAATVWLLVMTIGGVVAGGARGSVGGEVAAALAATVSIAGFAGFIGQTVLGAWTHLFPVFVTMVLPQRAVMTTPVRAELQTVLGGLRAPQLGLANFGTAALALGAALEPVAPVLARMGENVGLICLALVLALVVAKLGRALGIVWGITRPGTLMKAGQS
ncbi:MAG: hypothetical protein HY329_07795 [Chloroflexi bacterium]|nr:hypothetical protein [Chloroflexota bacterium]